MKIRFLITSVLVFILNLLIVVPSYAYHTGMSASIVVGQTDFTSGTGGTTQSKLTGSIIRSPFVDPSGRLIVPDQSNNRVLVWNQVPTANGVPADLVLGQADFASGTSNRGGTRDSNTFSAPTAVWSDGNRLLVADDGNSRVLMWNNFPIANGQAANIVIGQSDFTSAATTCDAVHINQAFGVTSYNGKILATTPTSSGRVMIWNSIPTTNGASADVVIGQSDLNTCVGHTTSSTSVNSPRNMAVGSDGKLFLVDNGVRRVLIYNSIPTNNNAAADVVVGQSDFTTATAGFSANILSDSQGVAVVGNRLYISDDGGKRVLIWNSIPTTNGASADLVLGQTDFVSNSTGTSDHQLKGALGMTATDRQVFISDTTNARILIFNNILSGPQLNITIPPTTNSDGTYHLVGNVLLGNRGTYSMQKVEASINGGTFGNVTNLKGGTNDGDTNTRYEFTEDLSPWSNNGTKENWSGNGYTISIRAQSFNAETDTQFYFSPFTLKSVSSNTYKLSVPKDKWNRLKDNLDSFSVSYSKDNKTWTTLQDGIKLADNTFDSSTGVLTLTTTKQFSSGWIKVIAKDKQGHSEDSNNLNTNSSGVVSYAPHLTLTNSWFPIQINSITGSNIGMISNYYPLTKTLFSTNTSNPTISGIAFAGSTIHVLVTNPTTFKSQTFTVITKPNSTFTITPTISSGSVLDVWVTKDGLVSEVPAFGLDIF